MVTNVKVEVPTDATNSVEVKRFLVPSGTLDSTIVLNPGDRYDYYIYDGLATTVTEVPLQPTQLPSPT